ncbi:hypothetical protein HS088_TW08G00895 [Tripterygium wilfordii]|uniref:Uncharacterized protein n=1 Tax=Tripterygium wilfordii TaxID=458696 RepID=A0A7J7DD40_TRIWF|nr:hypothetical protein HS088_TW08G00895 [Tripterygium wilfordii]
MSQMLTWELELFRLDIQKLASTHHDSNRERTATDVNDYEFKRGSRFSGTVVSVQSGSTATERSKILKREEIKAGGWHMQNANGLTSVHRVFTFLVPLLAALLALHMQGISQTPFHTNPGSMWTFIAAVIIYCFALSFPAILQSRPQQYFEKLSVNVAVVFGALAAICLLLPLLPVLLGRFVFVLWGLTVPIYIGFQHRKIFIPKAVQIWKRTLSSLNRRMAATELLPV